MNFGQDIANGLTCGLAMTFGTRTTNVAGQSVDFRETELQHGATLITGALEDGAHTVKLQESTDGTNNWTDITGGGFTAFTGNTTNQHKVKEVINFKRTKRYVRVTTAVAGGATTAVNNYGVLIQGQKKRTGATPQIT